MQIRLFLYVWHRFLTIDYSATSDRIFTNFSLLESSYRGESESDVNFVVSALVKKIFNNQNFNKIKLQMLLVNLHKIGIINLILIFF